MLILIILLPILGFLSGSLFGRYLGRNGVCIITTTSTLISFLFSLYTLLLIIKTGNTYIVTLSKWIYVDILQIHWSFCFDTLTCIMLVVVTFISSLVHLYSTEYMEKDPHLARFMSYLSLFTFFMLILVTANNFLQMFVGWEGVGVSSYLLINFWFTRLQANKAAIKAMLVNRVGDFFLLLGIFSIYFIFGTLDYDVVFTLVPFIQSYVIIIGGLELKIIDLICAFLFFGAMGKSAQLGLHTWLPDAMEGPTPVSALIHAATMVTAGVFLLTRCSYLFEFSTAILNFVLIIGALTAFFAATTGLFQNDIKKVIAYSTCSQLGYMIFACGLSSYQVGMFHLYNHAFFKALLFLSAGAIIHAVFDEQDMRKMGGLKNILPFSYSIILIGSFALMGFPFLAGFYSKDVILEISFANYTSFGHFSYILGILAAFCTAFYSTRLIYLVFLSNTNALKYNVFHAHEGGWRMTIPLLILAFLSIFIGYLSKELFIGFGTDAWGSSIFILPDNYWISDIEFIPLQFKLLPLIVTILGVLVSYFIYNYKLYSYFLIKKTWYYKWIYNFFNKKWFFDRIYNEIVNQTFLLESYFFFYKTIDRGLLEKLGPKGVVASISVFAFNVRALQSGFILHYLTYIFFGILLFISLSTKSILLTLPLFAIIYYMIKSN